MRVLRAGVIGLGVGERHVVSYQAIPGVEVRAVCDLDPERLREVADRHQVPERYTDARKITEHLDLDIVSICSYDDVHLEQAISSLRNGKHVMVEKPVVLFREDAQALVATQQESGLLLTSNLILRASPRFQELQRDVAAGRYGQLFYLEGDYLHHILDKVTEGWRGQMPFYCVTYGGGIHLIDLMRWIMGEEVTEVCGMGTDVRTRDSDFAYPDTLVHLLRFAGGALAKTTTTFGPERPKFHALDVYGTEGTFSNGLPHGRRWTSPDDPGTSVETPYPGIEKGDLLPGFVEAIREGREPLVRAVDVFRVLDVCLAAWDSVQQRRTVPVTYLM